jgi:RNA polymerase sigma-70 factor (ECF subfamily)
MGEHDAQDLTQAFFADLLARRALAAVAPAKGRFRSFLLVSAKHFLDNEWHKAHALKRGGDRVFIAWDALEPRDREALGPSDTLTPEKLYDRRWAWVLLDRAMEKLRNECAAAGKGPLFERLQDCLTGDPVAKSYQEIAAELQMTEGAVKVGVHRLRRRFGELLRAQVAQTVDDPNEVSDEIRELFAALE